MAELQDATKETEQVVRAYESSVAVARRRASGWKAEKDERAKWYDYYQ